jgi:hypothetical protein
MNFLSEDSQVRVSKFSSLKLPWFYEPITFRANLRLWCDLKQNCSPHQELSNGMSHVSKLGRFLTFSVPSFDHNLCFKCSNEQYEPILDIFVKITFQWYKKLFKLMGFDPCNCALKIQESIWDFNSHNGSSLGSVRVHSLTLFALLGASDMTPRSPSWPATSQPLALVVSPRLELRHYQCWTLSRTWQYQW